MFTLSALASALAPLAVTLQLCSLRKQRSPGEYPQQLAHAENELEAPQVGVDP